MDPQFTEVVFEEQVEERILTTRTQVESRQPLRHEVSRLFLDRVRSMASLLVAAVFVLTFLVQPFRIPSESMERTLLVGDFLLVNKAIYGPAGNWKWLFPYREPALADIVVFHFPLDPDDHVVKRVIALPNQRVHLHNGIVYRDGSALSEPYTQQRPSAYPTFIDTFRDDFPLSNFTDPAVDAHWWTVVRRNLVNGELVVPAQRYFVLGDNRNHSRDSRYWGFVPRDNIVGMPMLVYFSVREPSRTDPPQPVDVRLGKSEGSRLLDFARWERTLRVVY